MVSRQSKQLGPERTAIVQGSFLGVGHSQCVHSTAAWSVRQVAVWCACMVRMCVQVEDVAKILHAVPDQAHTEICFVKLFVCRGVISVTETLLALLTIVTSRGRLLSPFRSTIEQFSAAN